MEGFKQVQSGLHARYVLYTGQIQHFLRDIDLGQPGAGIHHRLQRRRQLEFSAFRMRRQCGQMRLEALAVEPEIIHGNANGAARSQAFND